MYEPSHFKVDDREALHAVMRAHALARLAAAGQGGLFADPVTDASALGLNDCEADTSSVLNGLNADSESEFQVMAQFVRTHALGGTA